VIVRLMGEGQYRIDDGLRERLNELDTRAGEAMEREDEKELDARLQEMWDLVQAEGDPLPADDLSPSDVLIPPADLTLEETGQLFAEHGLIPDLPAA
jgi:chromosome condensin MukBEF complex kleisin-like MukF subunit